MLWFGLHEKRAYLICIPDATKKRMTWSNKSLTTYYAFQGTLSITEQQVLIKKERAGGFQQPVVAKVHVRKLEDKTGK